MANYVDEKNVGTGQNYVKNADSGSDRSHSLAMEGNGEPGLQRQLKNRHIAMIR